MKVFEFHFVSVYYFLSCQLQDAFSIRECTCSHGCTSLPSASSRKDDFAVKEELVKCCPSCCVSGRSYGQWCGRSGFCPPAGAVWCVAGECGMWWLFVQTAVANNFRSFWYLSNFLDYRQISCCLLKGEIKNIFKNVSLSEPSTFKEQACFPLKCWETFYFPKVSKEEFLTKKHFFLLKLRQIL